MPEDKIKLPRSSYDELVKIIKAYGRFDEPVSLDQVSKTAAMRSTAISDNVAFLTAIAILERGQKKRSTDRGRQLARALEHGISDQIQQQWQGVIGESDFLSRLLTSVSIRGGMDDATLQAHIAYSAGEPKRRGVMTGARTVVDILQAAGVLVETDGKFMVAAGSPTARESDRDRPPTHARVVSGPARAAREAPVPERETARWAACVNVVIRVDCAPADLDGLGQKLRDLLRDITSRPPDEEAGPAVGTDED